MARLSLSLSFLLLLSLFSLSLARYQPEPDNLLPRPDRESEPSFFPQLPRPESESESESEIASLPEFPNPELEEKREFPEVTDAEPVEKPEISETIQYVVVPVHRFHDVRNFDNLQDIGFSLRLPMRHGHHHHRHGHRFGGFGRRFGNRFGHGFPGRRNQMEGYPGSMNGAEGRMMGMPQTPLPMPMREDMEMHENFFNYDKSMMPMDDEEKMERAKEIIKKMRKCKHHHMEKGMMHRHHEHHHEPREEPREGPREEGEEGGFIKQLWNLFNF